MMVPLLLIQEQLPYWVISFSYIGIASTNVFEASKHLKYSASGGLKNCSKHVVYGTHCVKTIVYVATPAPTPEDTG